MTVQYTLTISNLAISDLDNASIDGTTPTVPLPVGSGWSLFQSYASFNKIYYVWVKGSSAITVFVDYVVTGQEGPILVDATSGPVQITMPNMTVTNSVTIKKIDTTGNAVTIITPGAELIDGQNTQLISTTYVTLHIVTDQSNWFLV